MAKDQNLDFLDEFNVDEVADPTVNNSPIYRRVHGGFICGEATFAEGALKVFNPGTDEENRVLQLYFLLPADQADADGNDVVEFKWSIPKALKPAGIALVKLGVPVQAVKNGLIDASIESVAEHILPALADCTARVLQIPNAIKGKGGKRYPKQEVYTAEGWKALQGMYDGKLPTAATFGVTEATTGDAGDDVYDV